MKTGIFFGAGGRLRTSLANLLIFNCFVSCLSLAELNGASTNPPIFSSPVGLTTVRYYPDRNLYLYVSDSVQNAIYAINLNLDFNTYALDLTSNTVKLISGTPGTAGATPYSSPEGERYNQPCGLAWGQNTRVGSALSVRDPGHDYVADSGNGLIRGDGNIIAGSVGRRGNQDGSGTVATFSTPSYLVSNQDGTSLLVTDSGNHTVRKIEIAYVFALSHSITQATPDITTVSTLLGIAGIAGSADGEETTAKFNHPTGIAYCADGIYIADTGNETIRRYNANTHSVSTVAGLVGVTGSSDGVGANARFNHPTALTSAWDDGAMVADTGNSCIRWVKADGTVTTYGGLPGVAGLQDGPRATAQFNHPQGLCWYSGVLFVADTGNGVIRAIDSTTGAVTTLNLIQSSSSSSSSGSSSSSSSSGSSSSSSGSEHSSSGGGALNLWSMAAISLLALGRKTAPKW